MALLDNILTQLKKPPVLATIGSGVAGALSSGPQTTTVTPNENPAYATLGDMLRQRAKQRLAGSFDLGGYTASGIGNINEAFTGFGDTLNNELTSRGLASSPVAASAMSNADIARRGNIAQFLNTLPQVQRQIESQNFNDAAGFYNAAPQGQTQVTEQPGGALAGGIGSAAEMLAFLAGQGLIGGGETGGGLEQLIGLIGGGKSPVSGPGIPGMGEGGILTDAGGVAAGAVLPGIIGNTAGPALGGAGTVLGEGGILTDAGLGGTAPATAGGGGIGGFLTSTPFLAAAALTPAALAITKTNTRQYADEWTKNYQAQFDAKPNKTLQDFQSYLSKLYNFALISGKRDTVAHQALDSFTKTYGDPAQYGVSLQLPTGTGIIPGRFKDRGFFRAGGV